MDFSKFLLNDSQQKEHFTPRKILPKDIISEKDTTHTKNHNHNHNQKQKKKTHVIPDTKTQPKPLQDQHSFKKGDFIVIIGLENSPLNIYKGYFGEIIHSIPRNNSAYIILEGVNNSMTMQFPFEHFKHRF